MSRTRTFLEYLSARPGRVLVLLVALVLGQVALQAHGVGHVVGDDEPVCEVCVVSHSAALTGTGHVSLPDGGVAPLLRPLPSAVPQAAPRAAAARDPPAVPFS